MTRQERRWQRTRALELGMTLLLIVAFIVLNGRWMTAPLFGAFMAVFSLLTAGLLHRQYRVLDELGRLRWLKSYLSMAAVYSLGLAGLVLWSVWQAGAGPEMPSLPFYAVFTVMIAGGLASWATWHYLGWRDARE